VVVHLLTCCWLCIVLLWQILYPTLMSRASSILIGAPRPRFWP
jgi:hypothetical protein